MSKVNVYGSFVQALFFSSNVTIPKYFLNNYSKLGISHIEALLIIQVISDLETNPYPSSQQLAQRMNLDTTQVEEMFANLIHKKYLSVEPYWDSTEQRNLKRYSLVGLIDELSERWAIEYFREYEQQQRHLVEDSSQAPLGDPRIERIVKTFEQELARPITAIECEFIEGWLSSNYAEELIIGAFKRGVMAGIRNFKYIDSILREWEKKGLRTLVEVEADDAYFQSRHDKSLRNKTKAQAPKIPQTDKYENFYL